MNVPTRCPICNDVMLTEYPGIITIAKICKRRINHRITFMANEAGAQDIVETIQFRLSTYPTSYASWSPTSKVLCVVVSGNSKVTWLPYFEPDFSDQTKLVDKLKTYILFS